MWDICKCGKIGTISENFVDFAIAVYFVARCCRLYWTLIMLFRIWLYSLIWEWNTHTVREASIYTIYEKWKRISVPITKTSGYIRDYSKEKLSRGELILMWIVAVWRCEKGVSKEKKGLSHSSIWMCRIYISKLFSLSWTDINVRCRKSIYSI